MTRQIHELIYGRPINKQSLLDIKSDCTFPLDGAFGDRSRQKSVKKRIMHSFYPQGSSPILQHFLSSSPYHNLSAPLLQSLFMNFLKGQSRVLCSFDHEKLGVKKLSGLSLGCWFEFSVILDYIHT